MELYCNFCRVSSLHNFKIFCLPHPSECVCARASIEVSLFHKPQMLKVRNQTQVHSTMNHPGITEFADLHALLTTSPKSDEEG